MNDPLDASTPSGVRKFIEYFPEYPDDPRIKRVIHVGTDGTERVVYDALVVDPVNAHSAAEGHRTRNPHTESVVIA